MNGGKTLPKQPFNDVTDHYQQHVGLPSEKVDLKKQPPWIRWMGIILFGSMGLMVLCILILLVWEKVERFFEF